MSQELVNAMNDLYGNVSFGGPSSGGGGGGGGSSFSGPALEQERRNAGVSGHTRGRVTPLSSPIPSGTVGFLGDALIGSPGDNPDAGAMSDAQRRSNTRSFGGGGGGRGGAGR